MSGRKLNDSSIYTHNIAALSLRYPELSKKVINIEGDRSYQVIASEKKELPNLFFDYNGSIGTYYDNADPMGYSINYINSLHLKNARITFFLGIGLGYQLVYFAQHLISPLKVKHIIIIEKDLRIFKKTLEAVDLTPYISNKDIELYVGMELHEIFTNFMNYTMEKSLTFLLKTLKFITMPASQLLHKEYYKGTMGAINDACSRSIASTGNDPYDGFLGLENTFKNIPTTAKTPGINMLFNKLINRPAVVIAAGPSLKKNIHLLKDIYKKALLISVDASLRILIEKGIKPHLVTSIERVPGVRNLVEDVKGLDDVYYAVCDVVRPEALNAFAGPKIIVYRGYSYYDWFEIDRGKLTMGPSTANMAFKIAESLGCNPIILIGQDLAFGKDGYTHVQGVPSNQKMEEVPKETILEINGNDGKPIKTTAIWNMMLRYYEYDLSRYEGMCINATEGGARIGGANVMKFLDAIDMYCKDLFNPIKIIKENLSSFDGSDAEKKLIKIQDKIKDGMDTIDRLTNLCKTGKDLIEKFDKEVYYPILKGNKKLLENKGIENSYLDNTLVLIKKIIDEPFLNLMIGTPFQSYHYPFEMEKNHLLDLYEDPRIADLASIHRRKEWFETIGQLIVSAKHYILRGNQNIDAFLKTN